MRTLNLLPIVIVVLACHQGLQAQKVETFIEKFNERKIDEIPKLGKGYISPSLLEGEDSIIRPLVVVTHEEAKGIVDNYSKTILEEERKKNKEPKDKDLEELERGQKKLSAAWTEMLFIAKEAGVDVIALKHKIKNGKDLNFIVIIFASNGEVVMVKPLGSVDSKIDEDTMQLKGREIWISQLKHFKKEIEQASDGQPATAPESKPDAGEKPKTESVPTPR